MHTVLSPWENGTTESRWLLLPLSSKWLFFIGSLLGNSEVTEGVLLLLINCYTRNCPEILWLSTFYLPMMMWISDLIWAQQAVLLLVLWFPTCLQSSAGLTTAGWYKMASLLFLCWYRQLAGPCISSRLAQAYSYGSWVPKAAKEK